MGAGWCVGATLDLRADRMTLLPRRLPAPEAAEEGMVDSWDDRNSRTTLVLCNGGSELMVSYLLSKVFSQHFVQARTYGEESM